MAKSLVGFENQNLHSSIQRFTSGSCETPLASITFPACRNLGVGHLLGDFSAGCCSSCLTRAPLQGFVWNTESCGMIIKSSILLFTHWHWRFRDGLQCLFANVLFVLHSRVHYLFALLLSSTLVGNAVFRLEPEGQNLDLYFRHSEFQWYSRSEVLFWTHL